MVPDCVGCHRHRDTAPAVQNPGLLAQVVAAAWQDTVASCLFLASPPVWCQHALCAHSWSTNVDSSRKFLCLFLSVFFFLFNKVDCLQPVAKEEPPPPVTKFQSIGVQVEDEWR